MRQAARLYARIRYVPHLLQDDGSRRTYTWGKEIKLVIMAKIKFTNDILSDSLTRIRNSVLAKKESVLLPNTNLVLELLKVLSNRQFINSYTINEDGDVVVELKVDGTYKFSELIKVSKPGVRRYVSVTELRPVKGGRGLAILSTSKGVMSGEQARKEGVGGEYLCKIW